MGADDVPDGILTIVLSQTQKVAIVLRNGREAGRAPIVLNGPPLEGTTTYILLEGRKAEPSRIVPGRSALNWLAIGDGSRPDRVEPLAGEFARDCPSFRFRAEGVRQPAAGRDGGDHQRVAGDFGNRLQADGDDSGEATAPAAPASDRADPAPWSPGCRTLA
jgi:hypothetical protein